MPLTIALATAFGLGLASANSTRAGNYPFSHTLPGEVPAYDFTTGGPYMAPPIPYGHYAKDYVDEAHKLLACPACKLHALMGLGACLLHKGDGEGLGGHGFGHGLGNGHGHGGDAVDGGAGHGFGHGHGGGAALATEPALGSVISSDGRHASAGLFHHGAGSGPIAGTAVVGGAYAGGAVLPTGQIAAQSSAQMACGQPGCRVTSKHGHLGQSSGISGCGACGGRGCGLCGGSGLGGLHDGSGHGLGQNTGCGLCGGKGCSHCLGALASGLGGLGSSVHGKLATLLGLMHKQPKLTWFVGPGGPVPLTPGYVPYVVTTRSPRDYFSFAPMNPNDP